MISNTCRCGFKLNFLKRSWAVSKVHSVIQTFKLLIDYNFMELISFTGQIRWWISKVSKFFWSSVLAKYLGLCLRWCSYKKNFRMWGWLEQFQGRWVSVMEFHDPTLGIGKVLGQESTVVKRNYQIFGLHPVKFRQKSCVILGIKLFFLIKLSKNTFYKKGAPKLIFFHEKKI